MQPVTVTVSPIACTIHQATALSGLKATTIYRLMRDGDIESRKFGRRTLILCRSLETYLESLPKPDWSQEKGDVA